MDDVAMGIEDLDEPAHMSALEFLGQIHKHADGGHGILHLAGFVAHLDGEAESADADLVNREFTVVTVALHIVQFLHRGVVVFSRHG